MKVLVTGANGQLGSEIRSLANGFPKLSFVFANSGQLNIADEAAVHQCFAEQQPDACINCAAYTAVDKAESEREKAFAINATAVGYLAKACTTSGAKLIHLSTDFVFDGTLARPLLEEDATNPLSVYGASKLEGEKLAHHHAPNALIFRTSWVYSSFGNNFVKTIIRLCKEKPQLNIIFDQIGTPTYARDLAYALLQIVNSDKHLKQSGIFNFSNEGVCSWYDFAIAISNAAGLNTPIFPIETHEYPTPAIRPKYGVLNKKKFKTTFAQQIPYWKDSLVQCVELMN